MNEDILKTEILIIGAGMAGLSAGSALQAAGRQVMLLEKSRGVGGRLATRRIDNATFDHGAQFMTVRDPRLARLALQWRAEGTLKEWFEHAQKEHIRWRGQPGMTAMPKQMAHDLHVLLNQKAAAISLQGEHWQVLLENGESIRAGAVILTAPVPQSLALLDAGGTHLPEQTRAALEDITYEPCLAVMALLKEPSRIPKPGGMALTDGPIGWMADNQLKGISAVPAVTIHATPEFSRQYWEEDRRAAGLELLKAAAPWLAGEVIRFEVHGWRYARVTRPMQTGCLVTHKQPALIFAGDAFGGARVESAILSGWAAAQAMNS